ncbi:MAG: ABC transporter permease [Methanobacteriaceae archaeon]
MSFSRLVIKNPLRNKTRTALAVVGIAIGIATIVALGIITDGLKTSMEETLRAGESDFMVMESGVADMLFSSIDYKRVEELKNTTGIQDVVGVLLAVYPVEGTPIFVVTGINSDALPFAGVSMVEGKGFAEDKDEIIIGRVASQQLDKKLGDTLEIAGRKFKITGIYETGDFQRDVGAFMSLNRLQELEGREDEVTMMFATLDEDADLKEVTNRIDDTYENELITIKSLEEFGDIDLGLRMIDTVSWAISLLTIVIGAIGIINTMIMSVYERIREIGILKAVGWTNKRIVEMILGESLVITLLASFVGITMGLVAIQLLLLLGMEGVIEPVYRMDTFLKALGVAFFVGLIGGFYPAYRASRLPPTEALRYE